MSTDTTVDIEITLNDPIDETIEGTNQYNNFEKTMKLYNSLSTNNMHLFNDDEKLLKFDKETDIIEAYYPVRLKYYQKRKDYMINSLQKELLLLSNKTRYIQSTLSDEIDLRKKSKDSILNMLRDHKYDIMDGDNDYKYLLKMPMDSVSEENVNRLLKDKGNKEAELTLIQSTSIQEMWMNELEELKVNLSTPKTTIAKKHTKK
jgi:DNA topoisomerase-2